MLCHMIDYDGEGEWNPIRASDAYTAAMKYAEQCDSNSGGELFVDPLNDTHAVIVCNDDRSDPIEFTVGFGYQKEFYPMIYPGVRAVEVDQTRIG